LWVEIPRAMDEDTFLAGQRFTLKSDDGQYRVEKTPKDDKVGHEDLLSLDFPGVHMGPKYALVHSGSDGQSVEIFSGQPFESLFPDVDDLDGPRELPVHHAPAHLIREDGN